MRGTASSAPGRLPPHVVQLLGGGSAGAGAHVRSLAAGLVARGLRVTVCAPPTAGRRYALAATGARFVPVVARSRLEAVRVLRAVCADADLVHAHGMRVGMLASLALRRRPTPLVVTWHARSHRRGLPARLRRVTERWVARTASVVLGSTSDLVARARRRGARDARLAPVALPVPRLSAEGASPTTPGTAAAGLPGPRTPPNPAAHEGPAHKLRAELGAVDRPLLVTSVRLAPSQDPQALELLLAASRAWRDLTPRPLLVIAGEGARQADVRRRIEEERLPVRLLGRRDDAARLLRAADAAVLVVRWAARAPLAEEALRLGVPLVATAVGGVPELVGDAAVLVRYGDAEALGAAVGSLLGDPARCAELAAAGRARAGSWPTEDTTVAQVLSVYDELTGSP